MYSKFFGFTEKPFDVTPDPKFLYLNEAYREVLASLIYGIQERRGFITVVGEVGTGKTTLLNAVLDRLDEKTNAAYIFNTDVTFEQLLLNILVDLGLSKADTTLKREQALERLNRFAIEQLAKGYNIALIVDEAQNLDYRTMESLRLLSNLETRKLKLIQIILSGQPELDSKLNDPRLRQLAQRISLKRYIVPLNEKETYEYIQHRLAVAGCKRSSLFDRKAKQLIWNYSGGIPRKISILCDNAFLIAYGLKKRKISEDVIAEAIKDLTWSPFSEKTDHPHTSIPGKRPFRLTFAGAACIILASVALLAIGLWIGKHNLFTQTEKIPFSESVVRARVENPFEAPTPGPVKSAVQDEIKPVLSLEKTARAEAPPIGDLQKNEQKALESAVQDSPFETPAIFSIPVKTAGLEQLEKPETFKNISEPPKPEALSNADVGTGLKKQDRPARFALVKRGDTLYRIILKNYGDYSGRILGRVLKKNPEIGDPDKIFVGQKIELPGEKSGN
jgi:general secretion pathway protein A